MMQLGQTTSLNSVRPLLDQLLYWLELMKNIHVPYLLIKSIQRFKHGYSMILQKQSQSLLISPLKLPLLVLPHLQLLELLMIVQPSRLMPKYYIGMQSTLSMLKTLILESLFLTNNSKQQSKITKYLPTMLKQKLMINLQEKEMVQLYWQMYSFITEWEKL